MKLENHPDPRIRNAFYIGKNWCQRQAMIDAARAQLVPQARRSYVLAARAVNYAIVKHLQILRKL